jgi:hypothetical protein
MWGQLLRRQQKPAFKGDILSCSNNSPIHCLNL